MVTELLSNIKGRTNRCLQLDFNSCPACLPCIPPTFGEKSLGISMMLFWRPEEQTHPNGNKRSLSQFVISQSFLESDDEQIRYSEEASDSARLANWRI